MKKTLVIAGIVGIVILTLGTVGLAYAGSRVADITHFMGWSEEDHGSYMMGDGDDGFDHRRGGGMGEGRDMGDGVLHEYLVASFAGQLGISVEELEDLLETERTFQAAASSLGYSEEETADMLTQARIEALAQAVEDGVITQEEADEMLEGGRGFGRRGGGRGMMGEGGDKGVMHEYMIAGLAEALGLAPEELEERHEAGESFEDIALSLGFTEDELPGLFEEAHAEALALAVADGVITQEQADEMLERGGFGFGGGHGGGHHGGCDD